VTSEPRERRVTHRADMAILTDRRAVPILLVLGTFLVYANALTNGFVWDDFAVLVDNPAVRTLGNVPAFFTDYRTGIAADGIAYYRPLRTLVFAIMYGAFGLKNPMPYHALNVTVHVGNVLLVYGVCARLAGRHAVAAIVAAVFAVHPIMTEAVTNVTGLGDLLSACLVLSALYVHLRQRGRGALRPTGVAAVYGLFALALLAKETAITLPLLLLLADLLLHRQGRGARLTGGQTRYYLGIVAIAAAFVALRSRLIGGLGAGEWMGVTFTRTMLMQATVLVDYLRLLVLPVGQSVRHDVPIPESYLAPHVLGALVVLVGIVGLALWSIKRNPHVTFGIAWCFVALLPVMNLVPLRGAMIGERFLYVPMLGAVYAVVHAVGAKAGQWTSGRPSLPLAVTVALWTALSVLTVLRNAVWRDNVTVFEAAARVSPRSNAVRIGLIREYQRLGQLAKAEEHRRAGARNTALYVAQYLRLADRAARRGNGGEAQAWHRRVLRLDPHNSTARAALGSLGPPLDD